MIPEEVLEDVYITLSFLQIIVNALNLVIGIYFIAKTKNFALIHANLRLILNASLVVAFNLIALARWADQINENHRVFQPYTAVPNTSRWPAVWVRNGACLVIRLVHDSSVFVSASAILLIAIERLTATVFKKTYEEWGLKLGIGLVSTAYLTVAIASMGLIGWDVLITGSYKMSEAKQITCKTMHTHPVLLPSMWWVAFITCYFSSTILFLLYKSNVRDRARLLGDDLHTRYQYNENIATLYALRPAVVPYAAFVVVGTALATYTMFGYDLSRPSRAIEVNYQILYMIADLYGLTFMLIFMKQYRPLRNKLQKDWRMFLGKSRVEIEPESIIKFETDPTIIAKLYFDQLKNSWTPPLMNEVTNHNCPKKMRGGRTNEPSSVC